jgi:hypothetical protein
MGEPVGLIRHLIEEGERGKSAADGKKAGLEKFKKEL